MHSLLYIEEEVNVVQILLIGILLGGKNESCYTNAQLRNVHWKGKFLEGKFRRIFEFEKPALQW